MKDLGLVCRSDMHKFAVKHLYQQRKQARMEFV